MSGMGQRGFGAGAIPTTPPSTAMGGAMGSVTGRGNMPAPAMLAQAPGTGERLAARGGGGPGPQGNRQMTGAMPPIGRPSPMQIASMGGGMPRVGPPPTGISPTMPSGGGGTGMPGAGQGGGGGRGAYLR
jgi:hypothetical protein